MKLSDIRRKGLDKLIPNSPQHKVLRAADNGQGAETVASIPNRTGEIDSISNPLWQMRDFGFVITKPTNKTFTDYYKEGNMDYPMSLTSAGQRVLTALDRGEVVNLSMPVPPEQGENKQQFKFKVNDRQHKMLQVLYDEPGLSRSVVFGRISGSNSKSSSGGVFTTAWDRGTAMDTRLYKLGLIDMQRDKNAMRLSLTSRGKQVLRRLNSGKDVTGNASN